MNKPLYTDLQIQIESIHNPKDFERLVNELFSRVHGTDFIPTDYHRDGGMDGYISSSKTLIAKHCFEKVLPVKANRNDEILKKARDDLKKAILLAKNLDIRKWMFITSYLIPTEVFFKLKSEVENAGFEFECPGPSFIVDMLTKNKDVLQNHPYLYVVQIDESMKSIRQDLDKLITADQIAKTSEIVEKAQKPTLERRILVEQPKTSQNAFRADVQDETSKDYKRIIEIYDSSPTEGLEKEVKSIVYKTSDLIAGLQGVHLLAAWYRFSRDTVDDQLTFMDLGIDLARSLKNLDSEAVLLVEKGFLLSTKFVLDDLEGWGKIEMSNKMGISLITDGEKNILVGKLSSMNKEFNKLFQDALEKAYASNNALAVVKTYSRIGDAAGNRAGHFISLGINDRAIFEKRLCKNAFMQAKKIAAQVGDKKELAYVLYNFANALGFISEVEEALLVLEEAENLARENKMSDIMKKIEDLKRIVKEPKIKLIDKV